jgi:hypothetical protein
VATYSYPETPEEYKQIKTNCLWSMHKSTNIKNDMCPQELTCAYMHSSNLRLNGCVHHGNSICHLSQICADTHSKEGKKKIITSGVLLWACRGGRGSGDGLPNGKYKVGRYWHRCSHVPIYQSLLLQLLQLRHGEIRFNTSHCIRVWQCRRYRHCYYTIIF